MKNLFFKSDHILALLVHVLMITGADFEVASVILDPIDLTQQLIALSDESIPLNLHRFELGALGVLLRQRMPINGHHDGHHQKYETEFPESNESPQTTFDVLRLFVLDLYFLILHGGAASSGGVG